MLPAPCLASPFPSPGRRHLLPCSELFRAPGRFPPPRLARGPRRVQGAAGSRSSTCRMPWPPLRHGGPCPVQGHHILHRQLWEGLDPCCPPPAPARHRPAEPPHAAEALVLTHSRTRLTWRPALSSPLPLVGPPQGGVHPRVGCARAAGQGHHNRLSHLARPALPRRDLCRQPPDAREELCRIQGVTVTESPPRQSPAQPPDPSLLLGLTAPPPHGQATGARHEDRVEPKKHHGDLVKRFLGLRGLGEDPAPLTAVPALEVAPAARGCQLAGKALGAGCRACPRCSRRRARPPGWAAPEWGQACGRLARPGLVLQCQGRVSLTCPVLQPAADSKSLSSL